jgi:hypothetical protein
MTVKITDKALREFIRNKLLSEEAGDDAQAEEFNPSAVSAISMDKPETPIEAEVHVTNNELGPPIADPAYMPQNLDELKVAVGKILESVPENSIPTAYKIVKKTISNLHDALRQRSELTPSTAFSESRGIEKLLALIVEQGYEMSDPLMRGEEKEEEEEEVEVRSASYDNDREISAPEPKPTDPTEQKSQFNRFFKKKMEDMLALAKARHADKLQGITDWNSVDTVLTPEEHLEIMDAYDASLSRKYPSLANASGKDFEPPVKATLVAAVEAFMKDQPVRAGTEISSEQDPDKAVSFQSREDYLADVELGKKSSQDQAAKEGLRRFLFSMSVGIKDYYQGIIDIVKNPDRVGDKTLVKSVNNALEKFVELGEKKPETDQEYFELIAYMNADTEPEEKKNLRTSVLARAAEHLMSDLGFAGSKGGASRPHINKDVTLNNLKSAIAGIKKRKDRKGAQDLDSLKDVLGKMLPKGVRVPVVNISDEEDEEAEEKVAVTRSPGGKTFRRRKGEDVVAERLTPAEAILRSSPVQPDVEKAIKAIT